jgi:hypothetical protein
MRALFITALAKHRAEVRMEERHVEEEKLEKQEARRMDRKAILWSADIFSTGGGEFIYQLGGEKRQALPE